MDLTPEFCAAARLLTAMTGLSERVEVVEADATPRALVPAGSGVMLGCVGDDDGEVGLPQRA